MPPTDLPPAPAVRATQADCAGGYVDGFRSPLRTARPQGRSPVRRHADALRRTNRLACSLARTRAAGGNAPGGGASRTHCVYPLRAAGTARGRRGRVAALLRALAPYDRRAARSPPDPAGADARGPPPAR